LFAEQVIPKSHLLRLLPHTLIPAPLTTVSALSLSPSFSRALAAADASAAADLGLAATIDAGAAKPVTITLAPGDVLLHSMYLVKRELAPRKQR
jgi:hypothetical protein